MGTLKTLGGARTREDAEQRAEERAKERAHERLAPKVHRASALGLDVAAEAARHLGHDALGNHLARVAHKIDADTEANE